MWMTGFLGLKEVVEVLQPVLNKSNSSIIIDLCSGGGGPIPKVHYLLKKRHDGLKNLKSVLTDLYPEVANWKEITKDIDGLNYYA